MKKLLVISILQLSICSLFAQKKSNYQSFDEIFDHVLKGFEVNDSLEKRNEIGIYGNAITKFMINADEGKKATIHYFGHNEKRVNRIIQIFNFDDKKLYEYLFIHSHSVEEVSFDSKHGKLIDKKNTYDDNQGYYKEFVYRNSKKIDSICRPLIYSKQNDFTIEDIYGAWWSETSQNAAMDFGFDSVFYMDNLEQYPYQILNDTLYIYFTDFTNKYEILEITGDFLIFKNSYGVVHGLSRYEY